MGDSQTKQLGSVRFSGLDPAEQARRELVEWCQRRGLPVPQERRAPRR